MAEIRKQLSEVGFHDNCCSNTRDEYQVSLNAAARTLDQRRSNRQTLELDNKTGQHSLGDA